MLALNPYLFIVGCRQSDTALLRRMVGEHPEIAITGEAHWISEVVGRGRGIDLGGRASPRLPEVLEARPTFATLGIGREELERLADGRPPYPAFVAALFDRYGAARGKRIVGGTTPGYVQETGLLHDLFPHARFVHLVRDGRDVCLSELEARFRACVDAPVTTAALWWRWHVLQCRASGARLAPERYLELGYEALVADPEGECRRLCDFLDVAFDPAMLRFHQGRRRFEAGWTTRMPREQVEEFEAAAGDALEAFGYRRSARGVTRRA